MASTIVNLLENRKVLDVNWHEYSFLSNTQHKLKTQNTSNDVMLTW